MKTKTNKDIPEWDLKIKMDPKDKKEWIMALLSGDYKQGGSWLSRGGEYCCMGVKAKLDGFSDETMGDHGFLTALGDGYSLFQQTSGGRSLQSQIAYLNDLEGYTFEDLAEVIDHNL